jgi:hypothetical protein
MKEKSNEWNSVIKDLKNIRKLPLEVWEYILDISNIHYMSWKYTIKDSQKNIKINLPIYVWRNVYNCVTELYTVNVFTRYNEPYLTLKEIQTKKMEKIVSNKNIPEYIMTKFANNKIIFE